MINDQLAAARPGLMRFACTQDVAPDAVEDVVQETLMEAWRHFDQLQRPERFDAWLYGICRNVCLRWKQTRSKAILRQASLSNLCIDEPGQSPEIWEETLADPAALDPVEAFGSQELALLLDRALGYLPDGMREAVEMHYLAGLPQQEAALRLGLSIKALEVRLVRARRQLRQVLSGELHDEAEAFGLAVDEETSAGWQETRLWCMFCGHHHLQGLLDSLSDGRVNLRLRCPDCEQYGSREWIRSGGLVELCGLRSFRPAFNRSQLIATDYWTSPAKRERCPYCQAPVKIRLLGPGESLPWLIPFFSPAYGALIPLLMKEQQLTAANSLNSLGEELTRLVGPMFGGLLLGLLGLKSVVLFDSFSYVFSGMMILLIVLPHVERVVKSRDVTVVLSFVGVWYEWREGLRLMRTERVITALFLVVGTAMIGEGMGRAVYVPFLSGVAGGSTLLFSWMLTAQGVGGVVGAFMLNRVSKRVPLTSLIALGGMVGGAIVLVEVAFPVVPVVFICIALAGAPVVFFFVSVYTLLQKSVVDQFRGRVFGAYYTNNTVLLLVGMALSSMMGGSVGIRAMMYLMGGFYVLAGLVALVVLQGSLDNL